MKPKVKLPTEKEITQEIRAFLRAHRIFHWKVWQGLGSTPGIADILGVFRGRLLAIEVKGQRGKLSPKQEEFIERVNQEGGIGFVARSVHDLLEPLGLTEKV